jgi:mycothiol system anti-sigma-R factor
VSCGNPHETDCGKVIDQVYLYLDGEMPDADCAEVRRHLEDCAPCLREYGLEQVFKTLVARSCGCDETPPDFKQRVLGRLREVRMEIARLEFGPE